MLGKLTDKNCNNQDEYKMNKEIIYDIIGVGIGPFNLSLACLTDDIDDLKTVFFDRKACFDWHSGIMPEWSTLQIPFIADLVSFADPTNRFSFLNYLKETNNLYQFFIRESFYMLRSEYNQYCKWASQQLHNLHFKTNVECIQYDADLQHYILTVKQENSQKTSQYYAKNLVLGTGTTPIIPEFCKGMSHKVHSSADYMHHKEDYGNKKSITIVGGGQSGAEIYYDLLSSIDTSQYQLNWMTRSAHFFSMDLGKLTLEYTSPDYTNHFYSLPQQKRDDVIKSQSALYKGIEIGLVNRIYDQLYLKSRPSPLSTRLMPNSTLESVTETENGLVLVFYNSDTDQKFKIQSDILILALGYEYKIPKFLEPIRHLICWDKKGRMEVNHHYAINAIENIFVQNVGLYSHGFTVPDLNMGCYRNAIIINQILGKTVFPIEQRIAYQEFKPLPEEIIN